MKSRLLRMITIAIFSFSSLVTGEAAQASTAVDTTQVVKAAGIAISDTVTVTASNLCFSVTGPVGTEYITAENLRLSLDWGFDPVELWPQTERFPIVAGKATICFEAANWSDQLDLTEASNFVLTGKIGYPIFPRQLWPFNQKHSG